MVFHKTHGMNQPLFSMRTLYVSRTPADSSVYPTISAALDAIPMDLNEPACIYLAPGIYHEKITINKPYLTILGTGKSNKDVVLTYDDYALAPMADIGKLGTFRSYSVFIDTHDEHCKISQLKMHRAILSHTDRQSRSMPMVTGL